MNDLGFVMSIGLADIPQTRQVERELVRQLR
jgi:hypothetical protein